MMKMPKGFLKPSGVVSLLPQYMNSEAMYERFLNAALFEHDEIERAFNSRGIKLTDEHEIKNDSLNYFSEKKDALETEFLTELTSFLGEARAELFCEIISKHWFDGRLERESSPVKRLMAAIKRYLIEYKCVDRKNIRVINDCVGRAKSIFDESEIEEILNVNKSMTYAHLCNWLEGHKNYLEMTLSDIHFRRGLFLDTPFEDEEEYLEGQYINSYSLAFTVTEKFSRMKPGSTPVIVNIPYDNIDDRILFFSPFIKGMPIGQFEFGIIPSWKKQKIRHQGKFGGIHEYIIV